MVDIIPAILPKNYEDLKNKIALVRGVVDIVQIDICDGVFVRNKTWPFQGEELDFHFRKILNEEEGMPFWEDMNFELDLLVKDAVSNFDIYTKMGPKSIIFHIEAVGDKQEFYNFLEGIDSYTRESINFGIAFNPSTSLESVLSLIPLVDFIQFMGSDELGEHGRDLDERVYDKIKIIREQYEGLPIAVDIGVNRNTAPILISSGATKLVSGSAIFNADDIIEEIERLKNF